MSDKTPQSQRRRYRKRRRAELEAETRQRITEAAVDLHGSIGPARTSISAVAERAGVQRGTVYRHFPDEEALFAACSSHWLSQHPLPDPEGWRSIDEPEERLRFALGELYAWFERGEYMIEKTTRDVALVPALVPAMEAFEGWFEDAAESLIAGRPERGHRRRCARAALGHALAFTTWRSLVREQGLARGEAIDLMERWTALAATGVGENPDRH